MEKLEKHIVGENGIHYTLGADELYYPDFEIPKTEKHQIGKYGWLRRKYLDEHQHYQYMKLVRSGELNQHLHEVDVECWKRVEKMVKQMAEKHGVTNQMKSKEWLKWLGMMDNFRSSAEEVVLNELVYR